MPNPLTFTIPVKTTNPLNGATGNTRWAGIVRTRQRREQRQATWTCMLASLRVSGVYSASLLPCVVTLTRIAPSSGLDDDALPASMKAIRDGITDTLGLKNDRDPRLTWKYDQRRGPKGRYAVEVTIERRGECAA